MLPKKLHIEQIERFHNKMNEIRNSIDEHDGDESKKDLVLNLYRQYYNMTKLWSRIDDFIEMEVKHEIDILSEQK